MAVIPHVIPGVTVVRASDQNALIDQVNENTQAIADFQVGGDPEAIQDMIDETVDTHVNAVEPHPAYDDLPSLTLIFQNGLV